MAFRRIKISEQLPGNSSFSHQTSVNPHFESKHKKKGSLYLRPDGTPNCTRLRTDEREPSSIINQQPLKSCVNSMHLGHSNNSVTKLSRAKKGLSNADSKKTRKNKHTISVINLSKGSEPKHKGSSTVTKRKHSTFDFSQKIKEKIEDFRVIANCLEEYTKEERKNNEEVNIGEVLKIIGAFNRSEIAPISKPLQKLINEMVHSIQSSLPQMKIKSSFKKSISFQSPEKQNEEYPKEVKSTVKKTQGSREYLIKREEFPGEVSTLEENLGRLKYESNRLKYFLQQISANPQNNKKGEDHSQVAREKLEQLQQLRDIAEEQAKIIRQLDNSEEQGTFRQEHQN